MTTDDIIDGDFFKSLADIETYDELPDKDVIVMYSPSCTYERAIMVIQQNPDRQFKLITHNSDRCVNTTLIPKNLVRWYAQNLNFKHEKIEPLPIGLENKKWHPYKRKILDHFLEVGISKHRKNYALCQFNPVTYEVERGPLFKMVMNGEVYAAPFYCLNGQDFIDYADNLIQHKFCLCPRGNGVDTHRFWEALLLGCIPIAKKHITHEFEDMPTALFIENWREVTKDFLNQEVSMSHTPLLTKEYWRRRILDENN